MFSKQNPAVGARPGTLAIPAGALPPTITIVQYDARTIDHYEVKDLKDLDRMRDTERCIWVDVQGLGDETMLRAIGNTFDIHPLALEDAVNVPQRAKTALYEHHQLIIARAPLRKDGNVFEGGDLVQVPQVCFLVGERYLLTFQERNFRFFDPVHARLIDGLGPMRRSGTDYLAYALIDAMVDQYYPVAQDLSDALEQLEDIIVDHPHPEVLTRIHSLRRQLVVLRRIGWPQREAIGAVLRHRTPFIREDVVPFLRDTHDHMTQIVELIDSSRDMASDLAEAFLSNISHRTNEIMKVLTLMASIFIPLTFVAGIYGMNFQNMPELGTQNGYFIVLLVMVVLAMGMTSYFRYRGWIGAAPPPFSGRGRSPRRGPVGGN